MHQYYRSGSFRRVHSIKIPCNAKIFDLLNIGAKINGTEEAYIIMSALFGVKGMLPTDGDNRVECELCKYGQLPYTRVPSVAFLYKTSLIHFFLPSDNKYSLLFWRLNIFEKQCCKNNIPPRFSHIDGLLSKCPKSCVFNLIHFWESKCP